MHSTDPTLPHASRDGVSRWRAWPGTRGPASLQGVVSGLPTASTTVRVLLCGEGIRRDCVAPAGRFSFDGLAPGAYRIEVRFDRLVLAKRVEIPEGHHFFSFGVRRPPARHAA